MELYVGKKNADFKTIQEAVDAAPASGGERTVIHIAEGVYSEKLVIQKPYIVLEGESAQSSAVTYHDYARMPMVDGTKCGTFRSYTAFIDTHDFTARNLSFINSSGLGKDVGQALALYTDGDRIAFENCRLEGSQDTLFAAPLPPKEIEPEGFRGPKEYAPRTRGRHHYKNCYIRGDIDFIFGGAAAYFEQCEIFSQRTDALPEKGKIYGYITAASTPEGQEYGFVFSRCRLSSDCPQGSVYLGRPWREFAKTVFLNCELGPHIHPSGWHDWDKAQARDTVLYAEFHNYGPGADTSGRASFSKQLQEEEAALYSRENVLKGEDGWSGV